MCRRKLLLCEPPDLEAYIKDQKVNNKEIWEDAGALPDEV